MNRMTLPHKQRGVTLLVGLIMLVLITLMVTAAFTLSSTNLKAVGNMQFRDEAVAAANVALERHISTDFTQDPVAAAYTVDVGGAQYTVNVATPVCTKVFALANLPPTDPDALKCIVGAGKSALCYETVWELAATVASTGAAAVTGAAVTVKQGVSKRIGVSQLRACT